MITVAVPAGPVALFARPADAQQTLTPGQKGQLFLSLLIHGVDVGTEGVDAGKRRGQQEAMVVASGHLWTRGVLSTLAGELSNRPGAVQATQKAGAVVGCEFVLLTYVSHRRGRRTRRSSLWRRSRATRPAQGSERARARRNQNLLRPDNRANASSMSAVRAAAHELTLCGASSRNSTRTL